MNTMEAGQQKTNLKLIQDVINQIGQDSELKEEDKKTIDLCVMTFSDDDGMEGWLPLSEYHGGTTRNKTEFHEVIECGTYHKKNLYDARNSMQMSVGFYYYR